MITTNDKWSYKVNFVKFPKDQYTSCSVGLKDKESGNYVNYQLFVLSKVEDLQDGDSIKIKRIISTELAYWNDKPQLKVTCEIEIVGKASQSTHTSHDMSSSVNTPSEEEFVSLPIDSDTLPF